MKNQVKTNAMRILESAGKNYSVVSYEYDEDNLDAVHAAMSAGLDPDVVFKTIVMISETKQIYVFCVPGRYEISLKKARELTGTKSISSLPLKELQKTTGYIRGGCSPLGMIKQYPTFIEESAQLCDRIYVSAGLRGMQLCVKPSDLAEVCKATFASFI